MSVTPSSTVVGIFTDQSLADQAMQALYDAGFAAEQILYSVPGTSGGIFGDLKSLFTGTSPERSNLANDLTAMGLSNEEAGYYASEYHTGKIILAVTAQGREQDAMNILHQYGANSPQTPSGSSYETPNDAQQPSHYAQQSNYAPYETPPQQDVGRNWPAQPLSHPPEEHAFEDYRTDTVSGTSTEDQTRQPVTSSYDAQSYSTQANIVTPGSDTEDQASQTGTTAPEYNANDQIAQSEMASTQAGTEDQTTPPVDDSSASPAYYQASQANAATTEQEVGTQASQLDQDTSDHVDELQQLLQQIQAIQQQLQEAKAQLQAAKDHEAQLQTAREREQQLQTTRQQLQDIQEELQATLAELRETQSRIEQYQ